MKLEVFDWWFEGRRRAVIKATGRGYWEYVPPPGFSVTPPSDTGPVFEQIFCVGAYDDLPPNLKEVCVPEEANTMLYLHKYGWELTPNWAPDEPFTKETSP